LIVRVSNFRLCPNLREAFARQPKEPDCDPLKLLKEMSLARNRPLKTELKAMITPIILAA
jgi:hypothetical protein